MKCVIFPSNIIFKNPLNSLSSAKYSCISNISNADKPDSANFDISKSHQGESSEQKFLHPVYQKQSVWGYSMSI